ncbi:MAG: hypothetical protein ACKVH8_10255 [Pirellulales bacterium]
MQYLDKIFDQLEHLGFEYNILSLAVAVAVFIIYAFLIQGSASRRY